MVRVSPAARKSKLLSAALNVATIVPPPKPLLIEVVSADPSTALSPPGGASPPDQVIEARLTLSVAVGVELVKLKVVEGAVSSPVLPVVWGISMIGCAPAPVSTGGGALGWRISRAPELAAVTLMATWSGIAAFSD